MNERIRELAEQAGPLQEVLSEIHGGTPGRYVKNKALLDFQLEKFAELIVRECSQFVEDKFDFCGDEIIIAEKIKEHFGVEE